MRTVTTAENNSLKNTQTITSVELAKVTGRRHDVLQKSIVRMNEDLITMHKPPVVEYEYETGYNNIKGKGYILTIYQCELLALALDGIARIKVLDKLEEFRNNQTPTYEIKNFENYLEIPKSYIKQIFSYLILENEAYGSCLKKQVETSNLLFEAGRDAIKIIEELKEENRILKQKRLIQSKLFEEERESFTVPEVAKLLKIPRNNFYKKLREKRFLKLNNEPYKIYDNKYFYTKTVYFGIQKKAGVRKTFITKIGLEFLKENIK